MVNALKGVNTTDRISRVGVSSFKYQLSAKCLTYFILSPSNSFTKVPRDWGPQANDLVVNSVDPDHRHGPTIRYTIKILPSNRLNDCFRD